MSPRKLTDERGVLIRQARVLDLDGDPHDPTIADILIRGDRIDAVGRDIVVDVHDFQEIDGAGLLAIPGLVNAHYHSHDALLKGAFDTSSLERWALDALPRGRDHGRL